MFGSFRGGIQVWLVERGTGCSPWGVAGVEGGKRNSVHHNVQSLVPVEMVWMDCTN